jgi:hypothetical protein
LEAVPASNEPTDGTAQLIRQSKTIGKAAPGWQNLLPCHTRGHALGQDPVVNAGKNPFENSLGILLSLKGPWNKR